VESSIAGNLPKNAQTLAKDVGSKLSSKAEELRDDAGSVLTKTVGRAQAMGRQGFDAVSDAAQRAQEIASDTSDSIIRYTKRNPVKAILIAAASGALLLSVIQLLRSDRD
jgi:ElaB/YqjD/DUF883 family membrane-anchored ribosome-binding protein